MTTELASQSPYVGPRPFEQDEADLFFGREDEVRELLSHVVANRVVLFYAASGAGKTSLLNAGVIPLLEREERFEILPTARLRRLAPAEAAGPGAENVHVGATLLSWTGDEASWEPTTPARIAEFLASLPQQRDARDRRLPRAILFDQFEELFTVYPEHWEQREAFFEQLAEALEADPYLHVVLALREDYLANLDPYLHLLPPVTRLRLERLDEDAALRATKGPLETTGRRFASGVAEDLVANLRELRVDTGRGESVAVKGEFVEPVHLQVVCHNLWSALPADVQEIDAGHLHRFGDVDEVLSRFYAEAIVAAASVGGIGEGELRAKLEQAFVTPVGTRGTAFFGATETARIPNTAIGELERQHLLRGEQRAGTRWLELTHDRLLEPIRKSNDLYRAATRRKRRRRVFASGVAIAAIAGGLLTFAALDGARSLNPKLLAGLRLGASSAAFSPDGQFVVTVSADGSARVWDLKKREPVANLPHPFPVSSVALSPDGQFVVTASADGSARVWDLNRVWDLKTREPVANLPHPFSVSSATFSHDGQSVVTASDDGSARVWSWEKEEVVANLPHPSPVSSAAFSPDGQLVVTTSADRSARVWDLKKREPVANLQHRDPVSSAAFSPDGQLVVTRGQFVLKASVWDWKKRELVANLPHPSPVSSAAFSRDGRFVVTASDDGSARVWDWRSETSVPIKELVLSRQKLRLDRAALGGNGELVVTVTPDGTAWIWDMYAAK